MVATKQLLIQVRMSQNVHLFAFDPSSYRDITKINFKVKKKTYLQIKIGTSLDNNSKEIKFLKILSGLAYFEKLDFYFKLKK